MRLVVCPPWPIPRARAVCMHPSPASCACAQLRMPCVHMVGTVHAGESLTVQSHSFLILTVPRLLVSHPFHFQVPSVDADEADGKDEAICPTDMHVITDDDLKAILEPLKSQPGVRFTMIADCCHSVRFAAHLL